MRLHQDRDAFEALIFDISRKTDIRSDIIEKRLLFNLTLT